LDQAGLEPAISSRIEGWVGITAPHDNNNGRESILDHFRRRKNHGILRILANFLKPESFIRRRDVSFIAPARVTNRNQEGLASLVNLFSSHLKNPERACRSK
jgi:hypothetical protein